MPRASTGRWIVVSKRKRELLAKRHNQRELLLIAIPKPNCNLLISLIVESVAGAKMPHIACQIVVVVPLLMQREI
jgi:hypothetical protein